MSFRTTTLLLLSLPLVAVAQKRQPIIDVHLHAMTADAQGPPPLGMCTPIAEFPHWDPSVPYVEVFMAMFKEPPCKDPVWSPMTDQELMEQTLSAMEKLNIIGVVSGDLDRVKAWQKVLPERIIPALDLHIDEHAPRPEQVGELFKQGDIAVLGELLTQYRGILPTDERLAPYWAMAEELDIPVSIHLGPGPPGVIYLGAGQYRARMHSALTMEEVLVKYPKLRVNVMHAGFPMLDDLLAVLYAHPQVYVDVGVIVYTQPRPAFYRYLQAIMDHGFGKRVMFGTDQMVWPGVIERAVQVIEEAPFLSPEQKRDIFYNNAARFLRLSPEEIERHHKL
ncbi:MAG: amidohydrolase [Flavobacteriales bacterium]|nr:amidohydrolase [Flavobacteriales bacterium]